MTALHFCAYNDNTEGVKLLLKAVSEGREGEGEREGGVFIIYIIIIIKIGTHENMLIIVINSY